MHVYACLNFPGSFQGNIKQGTKLPAQSIIMFVYEIGFSYGIPHIKYCEQLCIAK